MAYNSVLSEELAEILAARTNAKRPERTPIDPGAAEAPILKFANGADFAKAEQAELCGLALSGGGIRSATFNLGVIQALAELKLLSRIDYLSTVSGGGYIGAWLTAWAHRGGGIGKVEETLRTSAGPSSLQPIRFLREHSNYLTPRTGFFGADTWSAISIYLRNLVLNMAILVGVLIAALLVPRMLLNLFEITHSWSSTIDLVGGSSPADWIAFVFMAPAVVIAGIHLRFLHRVWTTEPWMKKVSEQFRWLRFLHRPDEQQPWIYRFSQQSRVILGIVVPTFAAALFIAISTFWGEQDPALPLRELTPWKNYFSGVAVWWIILWLLHVAVWNVKAPERPRTAESARRPKWMVGLAAAISSVLSSLLAAAFLGLLDHSRMSETAAAVWMTLGVPVIIMIISASVTLNLGFMGRMVSEEVREWWSRVGGWLLIGSLAWAGFCGVALFGPLLLDVGGTRINLSASAVWLGTTLFGVLTASSPATSGKSGPSKLELAASVAPYVFVGGLLVLLSGLADVVLSAVQGALFAAGPAVPSCDPLESWTCHWSELHAISNTSTLLVFIIMGGAALLLSWRVDINDFSLQPLYRNRLVRCYLGASNTERKAHPFTGFDPDDDIALTKLGTQAHPLRPYPLVNAALNLVKGEDLAWQERKATAFTIGPLHIGFGERFYRYTEEYENGRLTLGEAFATSGAAASPNMGYHSNPALGFLMTVFNVRLGMWLSNPRHGKQHWRFWPRLSLGALVSELFGNTTDKANLVYLSDGGHFDNLGVYELIRRRCRFIIACDASADPHVRFDDLGSIFRKCRTDFGVDIALDTTSLQPDPNTTHSHTYCAVAHIQYIDGATGTLLYLKASLTGRESVDVLNYAAGEGTFPHQSTADQWFSESQFESYRRLGHGAARTVFAAAVRPDGNHPPTLERIFTALRERWYPATGIAATVFAEHGAALDRIIERIRANPSLSFLDAQIWPSWPELMAGTKPLPTTDLWLPDDAAVRRDGFYLCESVLQLMENAYLTLDLEVNADHPDNRGWMNLFRHWSWCGMLRVTWALTAATYGARFQTFCRDRLDLVIGKVVVEPIDLKDLNFLERDLAEKSPHKDRTHAIKLRVPNAAALPSTPVTKTAIDFIVGFTIIVGDVVEYLRVQDHLRKMGLARGALRYLFEKNANTSLAEGEGFKVLASEHEPSAGEARLRRIYESVRVELTSKN